MNADRSGYFPLLTHVLKTGRLECEVCSADFVKIYGERGQGFIEAHHKKPVSKLCENEKTKTSDLALVCSNCHRMIHRSNPMLSVAELKKLVLEYTLTN